MSAEMPLSPEDSEHSSPADPGMGPVTAVRSPSQSTHDAHSSPQSVMDPSSTAVAGASSMEQENQAVSSTSLQAVSAGGGGSGSAKLVPADSNVIQQPISTWLPMRMAEMEEAELSADGLDPSLYAELLAAYLAQPDLIQARLCWSRLPATVAARADVSGVWRVGEALLRGQFAEAARIHATSSYPANIRVALENDAIATFSPYMDSALQTARDSALRLIAHAYSSLRMRRLIAMLGVENEVEINAIIQRMQWTVAGDFVYPTPPVDASRAPMADISPEQAIAALVDCNVFLEASN